MSRLSWLWEDGKSQEEEAWDCFVEACGEYGEARRRLFETDPLPSVRKALAGGDGRFAALQLLRDVGWDRPELVQAVVPELYACSLGLGPPGIFARLVLRRLGESGHRYAEDLPTQLAPLVAATLREEVTDVFAMNALGMLMDDVGDPALLARWREAVSASPDEDVRELLELFED
ncbi:hypothetical protein AB0M97_09330 [Streptomyces sp. NPDC051207]|uniref:hypothetical protein n=1 Tax=Streptomyces sp. NPDC051207 TaxID=3154641 RepID=UPI00342E5A62